MKWKDFVDDYFQFTRRERIAIIVLIFIMILVFLAPSFLSPGVATSPTPIDSSWMVALNQLEQKDATKDDEQYNDNNKGYHNYDRVRRSAEKRKAELFLFDPNTLSSEGWEKLGLRERTIHTIQNYITKGGRFRKAEDVKRIYGLFPDEYERIAPYIRIKAEDVPTEQTTKTTYSNTNNKPAKTSTSRYSLIDINTADTTAFISLPGIGSKLSVRIVNFRDKLGGFYSVDQVGETFGLPDSTFQKIKPYLKLDNTSIRKININTATIDDLKVHPYIKYALANPIIAYRNEHGAFTNIEEIKKIMTITDEIYSKISPYLTL
ncbi:MAG TPA: helix-hairpin-helix domain-containing protein [Chitinophagaceae bacterium]|nr:helix-hairpin-helix domain-containing protein [Chitinophagaceae bacterium]